MDNFTKVFWIARKNNYTMYWDVTHKMWNCTTWDVIIKNDIFPKYEPNSIIDFYNGQIKFIR